MNSKDSRTDALEESVRSLADIHAKHASNMRPSQWWIEWLIDHIGRPWFAYVTGLLIAIWLGLGHFLGHKFDSTGYPTLQLILTILSFMLAAMILIAENRQGDSAEQRAKVTLQIAMIGEQKTAKIIELLEHLRHDDPTLPPRPDEEAQQMSEATDLQTAIDRMESAERNKNAEP